MSKKAKVTSGVKLIGISPSISRWAIKAEI